MVRVSGKERGYEEKMEGRRGEEGVEEKGGAKREGKGGIKRGGKEVVPLIVQSVVTPLHCTPSFGRAIPSMCGVQKFL